VSNLTAVKEGEGRWAPYGTDHKKPVRVKVHPLTPDEEREARKVAYPGKGAKLQKDTAVRKIERGEAWTREAAIAALEDSENFNVDLAGNARAEELFGKFPRTKAKTPAALETEVCFDQQWTPAVKRAFFSEFAFSKSVAAEIVEIAGKLSRRDADEEEEATGDFSQP
jgi:hypothetical protein